MMAAQPRQNYESSSSKAYDALIDQLENLPSPSNEPEITFNEEPAQPQVNDAQPAPPTITAPIQDETAQSHGNTLPQGLILPAQEAPQVQTLPPSYNNFNGYAQPREESKPTYSPPAVQSPPSYSLQPQSRVTPAVNDKYNGYPTLDHSEPSNSSYPSLETASAEDKIKNILQMYPGNPQPQQRPQPIMPQVQPVAPQPVISQPQYSQPHASPQMQQARPVYNQIPPQAQPQIQPQFQPQVQPQLNSLYNQPSPVVQQPKPVQQPQTVPSPQIARPQTLAPQPVAQQAPSPAPQQVQQIAQAQIQSQQINQQTVQVQVQQQQQIQVLQAQQLQQQNMIQQQIQYSKEMCIQMQSYFERIARFMENVDKRLNNLEKVTNDMLKNTSHASGNVNPVYPSSTPAHSEVPIENMFDRSELDRLKKLQSQFDDDAAVARRLQEEYERESKQSSAKPSTTSSTSSYKPATSTPAPKTTPGEKYETCPICQVQIVASKLTQHVNECLDGPSTYTDTKATPTPGNPDEKKGFWSSLFGGKKDETKTETPTPTPTPTQPVYDLSQPQNTKGTYYPAVVPNGTPSYPPPPSGTPGGYPPNGYPMVYPYQFPGNQPMYYYMPAQPQDRKSVV